NGELIVNLVKITEEIGETDFNIEIVENVLVRRGALNPNEDVDKLAFSDDDY
ncbi:5612_t:CDS:2, partial [Acaulospora colombiana]